MAGVGHLFQARGRKPAVPQGPADWANIAAAQNQELIRIPHRSSITDHDIEQRAEALLKQREVEEGRALARDRLHDLLDDSNHEIALRACELLLANPY